MNSHPNLLVTGAGGQLGRLVLAELAGLVATGAVAGLVRDPAKAADLAEAGVALRAGDYADAATLDAALAGIERLLLISSNALGARVEQHRNVIAAAARAGVQRIVYTSVLHADTSALGLAEEHRRTEALIRESGIPFVILRNGWYTENYAASIAPALAHGAFIGSAGEGRISSAARADYARAAAIALAGDAVAPGATLELAGDDSYTLAQFAAAIAAEAGRPVPYVDLPEAEYRAALIGAGLPEPLASLFADSDACAAKGALFDASGTLSALIGRPTTPFARTVAQTVREVSAAA